MLSDYKLFLIVLIFPSVGFVDWCMVLNGTCIMTEEQQVLILVIWSEVFSIDQLLSALLGRPVEVEAINPNHWPTMPRNQV